MIEEDQRRTREILRGGQEMLDFLESLRGQNPRPIGAGEEEAPEEEPQLPPADPQTPESVSSSENTCEPTLLSRRAMIW